LLACRSGGCVGGGLFGMVAWQPWAESGKTASDRL
jgi:hypothetical protein